MLLGIPGFKTDRWTMKFVSRALGRKVTDNEARTLLLDAAEQMEVNPTDLDHAIWDHERNRNESAPEPELEAEPQAEPELEAKPGPEPNTDPDVEQPDADSKS